MRPDHKIRTSAWLLFWDTLVQRRSSKAGVRDNLRKLFYSNTRLSLIHKKWGLLNQVQTCVAGTDTQCFVKAAKYKPKIDSITYNRKYDECWILFFIIFWSCSISKKYSLYFEHAHKGSFLLFYNCKATRKNRILWKLYKLATQKDF